jgi:hypothetical protein
MIYDRALFLNFRRFSRTFSTSIPNNSEVDVWAKWKKYGIYASPLLVSGLILGGIFNFPYIRYRIAEPLFPSFGNFLYQKI